MASFTLTRADEEEETPVENLKTGGFTLTLAPEEEQEKVVATLPQQVANVMEAEEEAIDEVDEVDEVKTSQTLEPSSFTSDMKRLAARHATNFTTVLATVGSGVFQFQKALKNA